MLLDLELTSELPLWDAARIFRVARHNASCCATPRPVFSNPTPSHASYVSSALACRCNEESIMPLGVIRRSAGASVHAIPPDAPMLRDLMTSATISTADQQNTTVDVASKSRTN